MSNKKEVKSYVLLSILGAVLLLLILLMNSSDSPTIHNLEKMFIGGVFISSCLFGLSLALRPNWFKRIMKQGSQNLNQRIHRMTTRKRQGHHPDCRQFKSHTIIIKDRILCAGCTGLALGSILSIFLALIYLSFFNDIPSYIVFLLTIIGMVLIAIAYVEIILPKRKPSVHMMSNIILVLGFLFVIVGVFQVTGNVIYGIFALAISFLWLDTRIQLSNWRHTLICKYCDKPCKAY